MSVLRGPSSPPVVSRRAGRGAALGAPTAAADLHDIGDQRVFLSTVAPSRRDRLMAVTIALFSLFAFIAVAPFAKVQLPIVPAFVPAYEAALLINYLITAVLLFGQFAILRSRALLAVAGGYLFSGLMAIPHALTFPGVFAPAGLLGAGPQTTAWLYISWHILFPMVIIAYALLKQGRGANAAVRNARAAIINTALAATLAVIGLTLMAIVGEPALPAILVGIHYTPTAIFSLIFVGVTTLLSLAVLWLRRPHTLLDMWLMVVMCAWLFDVGLSAALNNGRYDLGFYAGRIYVLLGGGFVLAVMLVETTRLYSRLAGAARRVSDYAATLEDGVRARTLDLQRANAALQAEISERERAEALLRRVFETSLDLIVVTDRSGTLLQVSPSVTPLLGYDPDELVGRSGADFVYYPGDLEATRNEMRIARRNGTTQNFECRYVHKHGRIVPFWWKGVWSASEQQHFFIGRDITERQALDQRVAERTAQLGRTNRQLNAILEAAPLSIFMLDLAGNVLLWTASAERLFGYTAEEATGGPPPYLDDDELAVWRNAFARSVAEASSGFNEAQRRCRDGTIIDASVTWAPVHNEDGTLLGVMYAIADITERRRTEDLLRQAQKMEAVGNLTGGMAHDFNNLLGIIIGNLDLLRDRQSGDAEADELSGDALDAALRGADLTRRLLAFARRQPLQPTRTDVNELIAGIVKLLERTLGEQFPITLDLNPGTWPVVVDRAQLESSLTNLATNARDAMLGGGQLIIVTGNRSLDADYASLHTDVDPGDYAMIEVSDTGTGMTAEVASRIFEPFFTTKEQGKGTGLGLSMVFGFMKQSGGHINVYSEVGVGTTFRLFLRRADAAVEADGGNLPTEFLRGGGETVLAVEDNPSLRGVVVRQLTELGYRVLEAEDALTALQVLEASRVDVLFTDIVMPGGTDGYELARSALSRWPAIKVVLTSGFPESRIDGEADAPSLRLLSKPYRRDELGRLIREVLDA